MFQQVYRVDVISFPLLLLLLHLGFGFICHRLVTVLCSAAMKSDGIHRTGHCHGKAPGVRLMTGEAGGRHVEVDEGRRDGEGFLKNRLDGIVLTLKTHSEMLLRTLCAVGR